MADDESGTAAGSVGRTDKMNITRKINVETKETNLVLSTGWRVETGCVRPCHVASGHPDVLLL